MEIPGHKEAILSSSAGSSRKSIGILIQGRKPQSVALIIGTGKSDNAFRWRTMAAHCQKAATSNSEDVYFRYNIIKYSLPLKTFYIFSRGIQLIL